MPASLVNLLHRTADKLVVGGRAHHAAFLGVLALLKDDLAQLEGERYAHHDQRAARHRQRDDRRDGQHALHNVGDRIAFEADLAGADDLPPAVDGQAQGAEEGAVGVSQVALVALAVEDGHAPLATEGLQAVQEEALAAAVLAHQNQGTVLPPLDLRDTLFQAFQVALAAKRARHVDRRQHLLVHAGVVGGRKVSGIEQVVALVVGVARRPCCVRGRLLPSPGQKVQPGHPPLLSPRRPPVAGRGCSTAYCTTPRRGRATAPRASVLTGSRAWGILA